MCFLIKESVVWYKCAKKKRMSYNRKSEKKCDIPYISLSTLIFLSKGKYIYIFNIIM